MITIREKDIKRIHHEIETNRNMGIKKEICITYIVDENGNIIDTNDLSENKIISLIKNDLTDYFDPEGTYKKRYRVKLDSFYLAPLVKDRFFPTVNGAYELYSLIPTHGEIIFKLLNDFGYMKIIQRAVIVAKFYKESHNDFRGIRFNEMLSVLRQMADNESEREYNTEKSLHQEL